MFVTRQAVSRWENGDTIPNTETLKLLSGLFDVSINTLRGSPRRLICQCCGMPLKDGNISREKDGLFNEEYCKWCYTDGKYTYHNMDDLIEFCAGHMADEQVSPNQVRAYMKETLPRLNYWKTYARLGGEAQFKAFKQQLMEEFRALHIEGMPEVNELHPLAGSDANLLYRLPNGKSAQLLDENDVYLGCRLPCLFGGERCFGLVADMRFLLVYASEEDDEVPELLAYIKR